MTKCRVLGLGHYWRLGLICTIFFCQFGISELVEWRDEVIATTDCSWSNRVLVLGFVPVENTVGTCQICYQLDRLVPFLCGSKINVIIDAFCIDTSKQAFLAESPARSLRFGPEQYIKCR